MRSLKYSLAAKIVLIGAPVIVSAQLVPVSPEAVDVRNVMPQPGGIFVFGEVLHGAPFLWSEEAGFEELTFLADWSDPTLLGAYAGGDILLFRSEDDLLYVYDRPAATATLLLEWTGEDTGDGLDPDVWRGPTFVSDDGRTFAYWGNFRNGSGELLPTGFHVVHVSAEGAYAVTSIPVEQRGTERIETLLEVTSNYLYLHYDTGEEGGWGRYVRRLEIGSGDEVVVAVSEEFASEFHSLGPFSENGVFYGSGFLDGGTHTGFRWSEADGVTRTAKVIAEVGSAVGPLVYLGALRDSPEFTDGFRQLDVGFAWEGSHSVAWMPPPAPEELPDPQYTYAEVEQWSGDGQWGLGTVTFARPHPEYTNEQQWTRRKVVWERDGRGQYLEEWFPSELSHPHNLILASDLSHFVLMDEGRALWLGGEAMAEHRNRIASIWPLKDFPWRQGGWRYVRDGLGWVFDEHWPWIYHRGLGGWAWVCYPSATLEEMWLWRWNSADWVWTSSYWNGWSWLNTLNQWVNFED